MFPFRHYELYSYESRVFCRLLQKSPCLRAPREYIVETFNIRAPLYLPLSLSRLFLSLATCRYAPHTRTHTQTHTYTYSETEDEVGKVRYRASHCEGTPEAGVY